MDLDTVFLLSAVVGGTIMICQFVLTLMGLGDHGGMGDAADLGDVGSDFHLDPTASADGHHADSSWLFGVITLRSTVAAATFFGLVGMAMLRADFRPGASLAGGAAAGLAAMYGMFWIMQLIRKLESSGNEQIGNALGRPATVYVRIPAARQGAGKVQLSMQNRIVEFQAITDDAEPLQSGEAVEVVEIAGSDLVVVERVVAPVNA